MIRPVAEVWGGLWEHQRSLGLCAPRLGSCCVHQDAQVLPPAPGPTPLPHPDSSLAAVEIAHRC